MKTEISKIYHKAERRDMLAYVPFDAKHILELGCGEGNLGKLIKQRQSAEIWGVELNPAAAALAQKNLDRVLIGDVVHVLKKLPSHAFDCIIANDILEHLAFPDQLLQDVKKNMSPGCTVLVSLPNIRHWKALYEILILGDFRYRDLGTFDRTHLRFFTRKSICRLFKDTGYTITKIENSVPSSLKAFIPLTFLNVLLLGKISDWRYSHFAVVARPIECVTDNPKRKFGCIK